MAMKADRRPGATSTHRGRMVVALVVLSIIGSFLFLVLSNKITGGSAATASSTSTDPLASATVTTAPDGSTQSVQAPKVEPAVPDPFHVEAAAQAAEPTETMTGPSSETTTQVPEGSDEYRAMSDAAVSAVAKYCAWSWKQTPQQYVESIPGLTAPYKKVLSDAVVAAWPTVKAEKQDVTCESPTGEAVSAAKFDASGKKVTVNVQTRQQGSSTVTPKGKRTVSYVVNLVRDDKGWGVDYISA